MGTMDRLFDGSDPEMIVKIEVGKQYCDKNGEAKVICFVEKNWLVARRKGAAPFLMTLNKFAKAFKPVSSNTD